MTTINAMHGSRIPFNEFSDKATFFTINREIAEGFAKPQDDNDLEGVAQIHSVVLNFNNIKIVDTCKELKFLDEDSALNDRAELIGDGYDGIMCASGNYILVFDFTNVSFLNTEII